MNPEMYKVSKLLYIENASSKIMEKYQICAKYETEPPHGDAIYSIYIKDKVLPFWIYGRDVTFIGSSMVMVESVQCKTWDPIETMIIDLENEAYVSLKEWYTDISIVNNRIELTNKVVKMEKLILNSFDELEWASY
ncbi:MAG: hypothetical protein ACFNZN_05660 [Veillonella parvula]|uniref:hypothetical protein n=1 Tax=Veillonella parvula TaxID=29466 RepID=UPI00360CC622